MERPQIHIRTERDWLGNVTEIEAVLLAPADPRDQTEDYLEEARRMVGEMRPALEQALMARWN